MIARYLKHFLETVPEEVEGLYQRGKAPPALQGTNGGGGTDWMEDDGTTDEPEL